MPINFTLNDKEEQVLALWACHQTIKETAKCLRLTPRQVHYYRCVLRSKLGAKNFEEAEHFIRLLDDYDTFTLMGQHLVVAYDLKRVQRKLAISQFG